MIGQNINIGDKKLRVLIAPLDWGLGHATRIITIVKTLQNYDVQVLIAAENAAAALLQQEFPEIEILPLRGYRIEYSKRKKYFLFKLLGQIPSIISTIKAENTWLKSVVKEYEIDGIISDNRFGFYHQSIPSVYITHQLFIETGISWMNSFAQKIHYKYIHRFSECWVPDFKEKENLAGKLSHPQKMPSIPVKYLGPLSRFTTMAETSISNELLIILSGPEPQRTIWENDLVKQIEEFNLTAILVRGKPGSDEVISTNKNLMVYNHLPAADLNKLIGDSALILSRCGYSTVMDLVALGKKAILVPTPGQAEQEYLAVYLKERKMFYSCNQQGLQLKNVINQAHDFPQQKLPVDFSITNEAVIKDWIKQLREKK